MAAISRWLQYALDARDFASLPDVAPADERDKLLTLLTIYDAPDELAEHPALVRLRRNLETWLEHTLDQRVRNGGSQSEEWLLKAAAQSSADFMNWFAANADNQQVESLLAVERGEGDPSGQPTSVLYRLALDRMLETNASLEPERLGSRALLALLPLPAHAEPERVRRGARWRDDVDARYLRDLHTLLATRELTMT